MVTISKIYTRSGDSGQTHLVGGSLVAKNSLRISAAGEIDELNACIGIAAAEANRHTSAADLLSELADLQQRLFDLGAEVATPPDAATPCPVPTTARDIEMLEQKIDLLTAKVPVLTSFVLPGGHPITAALHLARTVCRRAERALFTLAEQEPLSPELLKFVNRLSDYLFALARHAAFLTGTPEVLWDSRRNTRTE